MLKIEELEKQLKNNQLNSLYLLYGEEFYLLETVVKKIKRQFGELVQGINYIIIDENSVEEIIANIETPAFGYEKKLVLIKDTGLLKKDGKRKNSKLINLKDKLLKYLEENILVIKETNILVFIEENVDKTPLFTFLDKNGIVCKFEYQKPIQIEKRLQGICRAYKVKIEPTTISYLIECCGTSMGNLINEIRKLIEYAGENGTITKQTVDLLVNKQIESIIFDLTDDLGKRNVKDAIKVLKNLIYQKEPIQKILITIYNHFKKLYIVKLAQKYNKDIAESLQLKPNQTFLIRKYQMQANYFNENELNKILNKLRNLDYHYKIGDIDILIGLETILCENCSK